MIKADFHVHTVLSPCGDVEMTPLFIVERAKSAGLSIVGITDHNSTLNANVIKEIGDREGIFILTGAEVTTSEEIHVLVFVDGKDKLRILQEFLETNIIKIKNNPDLFGYQLVVDEYENVTEEIEYLLINALDKTLDEVEMFVHSLGGIVIPAHINKSANSLLSQLGFIPRINNFDALEVLLRDGRVFFAGNEVDTGVKKLITSSDAHYIEDFGFSYSSISIEGDITFEKVKSSLKI